MTSERPRCRVAVVSPLPVVRHGLVAMLSAHDDEVELVRLGAGDQEPDVIVYDCAALHDGNGEDLDHFVHRTASHVLALSQDLRPDLVSQALARGADGSFSLAADEESLVAAVLSAHTAWHEGDEGPSPVVGAPDSVAGGHRLGRDVGLTAREVDVLTLITQGLSNQEIAQRCFLSINSVKTYIRSAYRRIGVTSRSQAVLWCVQHGFDSDSATPGGA